MKFLKGVFITALVFAILCHFLPKPLFAQEIILAEKANITEHPIESTSTPDEVLATVKDKKSNWLLWSLIGVALLGGIAAAAGGSGSDGGSGGDGGTPDPGSIPVQW